MVSLLDKIESLPSPAVSWRRDNDIKKGIYVPIETKDIEALFRYTDDLIYIHRELRGRLHPRSKPSKKESVDRLYHTFLVLRDELNFLDCSGEPMCRDAHNYVINAFHECWGVLPSRDLDDYRVWGCQPVSLSHDFLNECSSGHWIVENTDASHYFKMWSHEPKDEEMLPYWVSSLSAFANHFPHLAHKDEEEKIELLADRDYVFLIEDLLYADLERLDLLPSPDLPVRWVGEEEVERLRKGVSFGEEQRTENARVVVHR